MEYIEPGTAITIHGLNARPDLNGLNGVVLNYIPARERYHVKVFAVGDGAKEEEEIFLRPTNCSKKKDDDEENGRKRKESTTNEKEERAEMAASTKVAKVGTTEEEHGQTKEEREEKRAIENATLFEDDTTQTTTTTTTTTTKKVEKIEELKDDETLLKEFFKDVSQTDRASEVDRILSCFKLNPYEYLNVRFDATIQEVAKSFRKVSLLVHPDKCNHPKASVAFDAIGQAQKLLTTVDFKKEIDFNLDQAKKKVVSEYKKEMKGDTLLRVRFNGDKEKILEHFLASDEFHERWKIEGRKYIVDLEWRRRKMALRLKDEEKRVVSEEKQENQERKKIVNAEKGWNEEEARETRVGGWRDFASGKNKKKKKKEKKGLSMPKVRAETVERKDVPKFGLARERVLRPDEL
mmetsp:Transcript_11106/g.31416  ORF Transcript_11106/g.31416 Transcript_11106/m.31416 type:complete len:407 (-) Transcript_11106:17-1237(-)